MEESTGADRVFRRQAVHHIAPTDTGFDYPPMHILDSASSIVGTAAVAPALLLLWLVIAADESPAPPLRIWTAFVLGGHGDIKDHPVERWYRHLRAVGVLEGALSA